MTAGISYFDTCQILYVKYVCLSVCMQEFSRVSWNGMDCYGTMAWHIMVWFGMVWNGMYVAQCNVVYCDVMYSTVMEWSVGMQQWFFNCVLWCYCMLICIVYNCLSAQVMYFCLSLNWIDLNGMVWNGREWNVIVCLSVCLYVHTYVCRYVRTYVGR